LSLAQYGGGLQGEGGGEVVKRKGS